MNYYAEHKNAHNIKYTARTSRSSNLEPSAPALLCITTKVPNGLMDAFDVFTPFLWQFIRTSIVVEFLRKYFN